MNDFKYTKPVRKSHKWVVFLLINVAMVGLLSYIVLERVDADLRRDDARIQQCEEKLYNPPKKASEVLLGAYYFHDEAVHISEKLQHADGVHNVQPTDRVQDGSINIGVSHNPQVTYNLGGEL